MNSSIERQIARLQRIANLTGIEQDLEAAADDVIADVRVPAPMRPGQKYVRTGDLGGGWKKTSIQRQGRVVQTSVVNNVVYAVWVHDTERQAKIHQNRWRNRRKLIQDNRARVRARLVAGLKRLIRQ